MGLFRKDKPVTATVGGKGLQCLVCSGTQFWSREVKMNTSGMEYLGVEWANQSALGLVCAGCGYVHEFMGNAVQMYEAG